MLALAEADWPAQQQQQQPQQRDGAQCGVGLCASRQECMGK